MPYLGSSPDTAIDQKDLNGQKLIIDADADTSIHASTDDQIDVEVAGADVFQIKSSSGDAVIRAAVDAKDILLARCTLGDPLGHGTHVAAIAAGVILNQLLELNNLIGCLLILGGILLSQLAPIFEKNYK